MNETKERKIDQLLYLIWNHLEYGFRTSYNFGEIKKLGYKEFMVKLDNIVEHAKSTPMNLEGRDINARREILYAVAEIKSLVDKEEI